MRGSASELQRAYYASNAAQYDNAHVSDQDEHGVALNFMLSMAKLFDFQSVLDIGSGTGRALLRIKQSMPNARMLGIEPSPELRAIAVSKNISASEIVAGNAMSLAFEDRSFDLVCEFGALHHIPDPRLAVSEMLRVARKAIFISDCNNFGQGSAGSRLVKQAINALGLWRVADLIKTRGKGYSISEGDGVAYSYSVFDDYSEIQKQCEPTYLLSTSGGGPNLYRTAPHVAVLGIKKAG